MLTIGQKAPLALTLHDAQGREVSLSQVMMENPGKHIVLYFYPKDNTPGCTTQACAFRDQAEQIEKLGAVVIGVSKDSSTSHQKFTEKYELSFPLWSDPDHKLMDAFGVWGERSFMGKKYMGTSRSTFIINPDGKIVAVWEKANPKTNAQEVQDFLSQTV